LVNVEDKIGYEIIKNWLTNCVLKYQLLKFLYFFITTKAQTSQFKSKKSKPPTDCCLLIFAFLLHKIGRPIFN